MYEAVIRLGHYERLLDLTSMNEYLAATGLGYKSRMSPLSAAIGRVQLRHLAERGDPQRELHHARTSSRDAGLHPAVPRPRGSNEPTSNTSSGTTNRPRGFPSTTSPRPPGRGRPELSAPRYPLLHQMPVFTHGIWRSITRLADAERPDYDENDLPLTTEGNGSLIKLPSFPNADQGLVEQYATFQGARTRRRTAPGDGRAAPEQAAPRRRRGRTRIRSRRAAVMPP